MNNKLIKKQKQKSIAEYILVSADIETVIYNNVHTPIALGFMYEGVDPKVFFTKTPENSFIIIGEFLNAIINISVVHKSNIIIYFHNGSNFDMLIIMKALLSYKEANMVCRDNRFYQLSFKYQEYTIYWRDSYHMIPKSLNEAANILNLTKNKIFDVNSITLSNIRQDKNSQFWKSLKKYLITDIVILYNMLYFYREACYATFNLDAFSYRTLTSMSLDIFITKYYKSNLYRLEENKDVFVRCAYSGGISSVYKTKAKNVVVLDINSFYPSIMKNHDMPVGPGEWVFGNIVLEDFFGFVECDIIAPKFHIPPLPFNHPTKGLIEPYGTWRSIYFSEEVKYAKSKGYIVNPLRGVSFKRENIFNGIVTDIYQLRKNTKNKMEGMVAKLIMNSLYGRFGMRTYAQRTEVLNLGEKNIVEALHNIIRVVNLDDDKFLVTYHQAINNNAIQFIRKKFFNDMNTLFLLEKHLTRCNLISDRVIAAPHISAAITSYGRIFMNQFKLNKEIIYSDTDSFIILLQDIHFFTKFISKKLGDFKIESKAKLGYFKAPKVYALQFKCRNKIVFTGYPKIEISKNESNLIHWFKTSLTSSESISVQYEDLFSRHLNTLQIFSQKKIISFTPQLNKRYPTNNNNTKPFILKHHN